MPKPPPERHEADGFENTIMKTFHPGEVETLRAEVRSLQAQISRLEARLSDGDDDHEMRALWPYNWILSGVETVKGALVSRRKPQPKPKRLDPLEAEARFSRMMM